jgi:aldehyde:ferredoxin oxidoreductase
LWLENDKLELRSADHLWGLSTYETQSTVKIELREPKARVAAIGPAGEAKVPFALILCDHGRVAGRTGMGAVMGSKNLKAIAVKGGGSVPIADKASFAAIRQVANRSLRDDSVTVMMRELGSAGGSDYFDYLGEMPKRYYQSGVFEGAARISGSSFNENLLVGVSTCHGCVIACGRVVGLEKGDRRKGPEYETIVGFGPNLLIDDPVIVTRLGELCDQYGMDSISLSNTIGLAFRLFEMGVISVDDTGGIALHWGDTSTVEKLVHLTAKREGFGFYVSEGALALARRYGHEQEAVQVNGLEVAYHDPRGTSGMALVYATSPRGACHNQSDYYMVDVGQAEESVGLKYFPRQAGREKAINVARHQDWRTVWNALVLCFFANVPAETILALVNAACGYELNLSELLQTGERGWNLKRAINNRLGLTQANDKLPSAFLRPLPDGGSAGYVPDFAGMLEAYYEARGWDPKTGFPKPKILQTLGLGWVEKDLWPEN